jgi:hypothetical protein
VSVQNRCTVCAKCNSDSSQTYHRLENHLEIVLILTLVDEAQVDARFGPFGDSPNLDVRWVHGLCRMYHTLGNHCWTHSMDLLGDVGHVESRFVPFGDSVSISAI